MGPVWRAAAAGLIGGALIGTCLLGPVARAAPPDPGLDLAGFLDYVVALACAGVDDDPASLAGRLGAEALPEGTAPPTPFAPLELRFRLPSGDRLRILAVAQRGQVVQMVVELHEAVGEGPPRPLATALADEHCAIRGARRIEYGEDGLPLALVMLGPDLVETGEREPLNPPVPPGLDPGGVRVAIVDSGVNYELAAIAGRLARDAEGETLGFDWWEMDRRPFDADVSRSPFFPIRHGTQVASILLREAPAASLVPYRYPRPDLARMADLVEHAARAGVRIVTIPLGSRQPGEWQPFADAARAHPEILFVASAGNDGRDIDRQPVYPAALPLGNLLVVTSADEDGRLAAGSNWGPQSVDFMVPGERQEVLDFHGRPALASGSSFAVPRVAALAARLLAAHPEWDAQQLKDAILARAEPAAGDGPQPPRLGWIPDPAADG